MKRVLFLMVIALMTFVACETNQANNETAVKSYTVEFKKGDVSSLEEAAVKAEELAACGDWLCETTQNGDTVCHCQEECGRHCETL